jgi:hypothetical protein
MAAIADIKRQVYYPHVAGQGAPIVVPRYLGQSLRREEFLCFETSSDWNAGQQARTSDDNGCTWTDYRLYHDKWPMQSGWSKEQIPFATCYDPVSARTLQFVFQRLLCGDGDDGVDWGAAGQAYFDHGFYQLSDDEGRTWGELLQLRYQDGARFDPDNWIDPAYLQANTMYGGYQAIPTRDGTIIYPAVGVDMAITDQGHTETVSGAVCFIGRWDSVAGQYSWRASAPMGLPLRSSGRGLMEPSLAELADGRLLMIFRTSIDMDPQHPDRKVEEPGRKHLSISEDGGLTWSAITDLRYDNGEQFYSPSAFCRTIRHSRTGKLYWFGNICPNPPTGNMPREPLQIAELDEEIPAIRKETVTVIDDRGPQEDVAEQFQLSNFHLLENRQTGEFELYLTRYGERPQNWLDADVYKYTITLR